MRNFIWADNTALTEYLPTRGTERVVKTIEGQEGLFTIHPLIILLILPRSNMIHPFLVLEIPYYGLLDTLLKLERWFPTEFLLKLARIDGITQIKNR